jgi:hypothetical protein
MTTTPNPRRRFGNYPGDVRQADTIVAPHLTEQTWALVAVSAVYDAERDLTTIEFEVDNTGQYRSLWEMSEYNERHTPRAFPAFFKQVA